MNVVPVSVGECWLGSLVGMQPRPRTAFQTALATVIPVSVGRSNRGGGCSGGGRSKLAPNTAFQLTRAVWRSTRSSAFWHLEAAENGRERRGQLNATVGLQIEHLCYIEAMHSFCKGR